MNDVMKQASELISDIAFKERQKVADEAYEFQGTVSQFATTKECIAHNRALRDFAEYILAKKD